MLEPQGAAGGEIGFRRATQCGRRRAKLGRGRGIRYREVDDLHNLELCAPDSPAATPSIWRIAQLLLAHGRNPGRNGRHPDRYGGAAKRIPFTARNLDQPSESC